MAEILLSLKRTVFLPKGSPGIFSVNNIRVDIRNPDIKGENGKIFCLGDADILLEYLSQDPGSDLRPGIMVANESRGKTSEPLPWQALLTLPFELVNEGVMACPPLSLLSIEDIKWFVVAPRAIELEVTIKLLTDEDKWEGDHETEMEKMKGYRPEVMAAAKEKDQKADLEDRVYIGLDENENKQAAMVNEQVAKVQMPEEKAEMPAAKEKMAEKPNPVSEKNAQDEKSVNMEADNKEADNKERIIKPGYIVLEQPEKVDKKAEKARSEVMEEAKEHYCEQDVLEEDEPEYCGEIMELYEMPMMMEECHDRECENTEEISRHKKHLPVIEMDEYLEGKILGKMSGVLPERKDKQEDQILAGKKADRLMREINNPYPDRAAAIKEPIVETIDHDRKCNMRFCRVLAGEDLEGVASRTGVPGNILASRNRLNNSNLKEGMYLIIPE